MRVTKTRPRECSAEKRVQIVASRRATALRRRHQVGFVYECKVVEKRLNAKQREELKRLFVEGKWFYNHVLNLHKEGKEFSKIDTSAIKEVVHRDKNKNEITDRLRCLNAQEKQAIVVRMWNNERTIETLKRRGYQKDGELHYMSEMTCIPLKQYGVTYKFKSANKVRVGGVSGTLLLRTGGQLDKVDEFANANLVHRADGYFLKITCFINENKLEPRESNGKEIGLDFGIKDTLTTSEGEKIDVLVEESERLKRLQREMFRRTRGSNNRYRTIQKIRREYQRIKHRKTDKANKIVSKLKKYDTIVMQDEPIAGWHRGLFGKQVQHSCLGVLKSKLMALPQTVVLESGIPTTKMCPKCKTINQYVTMGDRVYKCGCGYESDRDVHAARNMLAIKEMVLGNDVKKLPLERREVTLTEFRASIGDLTAPDKSERRSEKMPCL